MSNIVYIGNDHLLELTGLKNAAADQYLNAASVSVTVKDASGAEVVGETWPLSASYVAGSDGDYRAVLADALALTAGAAYVAEVTADGGPGLRGFWSYPFTVRDRIT